MGDYSKSRLPVGGSEKRREQEPSTKNYSTDLTASQAALMENLGIGSANALRTDDLLRMTGIPNARALRHIVADLRRGGALVLANGNGYFLPGPGEAGRDEVAAFVSYVDGKAAATFRAADAARRFLREVIPGQTVITKGGADE